VWQLLDNIVEVVLNEVLKAQVGTLLSALSVLAFVTFKIFLLPFSETIFGDVKLDRVVASSNSLDVIV